LHWLGGSSVDRRVGQELLKLIAPLGVEASLRALEELSAAGAAQCAALCRQLEQLVKEIVRGKIDVVAAWSVDRLGRSLQDLVGFLGELNAAGCDLYLEKQAVDTTTPAGRALFQMLGVFAEFERAIIQERIHAGLARARDKGTKSGKPIGRARIGATKEAAIRAALASGKGGSNPDGLTTIKGNLIRKLGTRAILDNSRSDRRLGSI
jgi:DNA invertase Pin-like site-specific DNA recombinase